MKFAQYLQDTQTPEWKKAYINYRALKKRISVIRRADAAFPPSTAPDPSDPSTADNSPTSDSPLLARLHSRTGYGSAHSHDTPSAIASGSAIPSGAGAGVGRPKTKRRTSSSFTARRSISSQHPQSSTHSGPIHTRIPALTTPLPLATLLPLLPPEHRAFFDTLDAEREKIEIFYMEREKEAEARASILKSQLEELKGHRKLFYDAHPPSSSPFTFQLTSRSPFSLSLPARLSAAIHHSHPHDADPGHVGGRGDGRELDPEEYQHAKKKLRKAVLEFYRGLEVLNNYRVMNLTGFRKALKKYEKVTKIQAQQSYIKEKIEPSAFASGTEVSRLMHEMEELFAARFERGDRKRAMDRLRAGARVKSHHFSAFRTGIILGLGVPPFIVGLYESFQPTTRSAIPPWGALLYIYGVLLIPVLFSLLVGLNLLVWSNARINYVFIFELDVRTRLDHREYFEVPAFLLATLSYAFWLSFARIGSETIASTTWPLIWLIFALVVLLNPLPVLFKPARWWLVRNVLKLLTSGTHHVEFTDFWMGDQFCSLIFTLSNLYFFFCVYADGFDAAWTHCSRPHKWGVPFALASLPLFARLVQSVRRYIDSRLVTHLINGGKYGSGVLYYLFYFYWRHEGGTGRGASFVFFCLCGTIYATYASAWDILMDWSLMRPHVKYRLLRPDLVYSNHVPLYYFAIISNILIRFIWVFYIPTDGPNFYFRTFIGAMLEMLRRWQWNIYRLENEHIGNMDQYRVTRDVPLPYQFDDPMQDHNDSEDRDEDAVSMSSSWIRRQRKETGAAVAALSNDSESQS